MFFENILEGNKPFFLQKKEESDYVNMYIGDINYFYSITDIPINTAKENVEKVDTINVIPFSQAKERGFSVIDNKESIISLSVNENLNVSVDNFIKKIEDVNLDIKNIIYEQSEEEYRKVIENILYKEIGYGEGANFVIPRRFSMDLDVSNKEENHLAILNIFKKLLVNEFGAYSTFLFFDGSQYFVGASPERHISKRKKEVMMNPISGTFRKNETSQSTFEKDFYHFLNDKKEIYELFMVTDEELKIMCDLCEDGGIIVGPFIKEMSKLIHTEYLLVGNSNKDIHSLIKDSMFAPTVTGSPMENAFNIIKKYENESRSYYSSMIAIVGRDCDGESTLDAPITIRTLEIDSLGKVKVKVGATLVKGSNPIDEIKETESKISGVISSILNKNNKMHTIKSLSNTLDQRKLELELQKRNVNLSRFWFDFQHISYNKVRSIEGKNIVIVDANDSFSKMLKRMLSFMGANLELVSIEGYKKVYINDKDLIVFGPGPGDPRRYNDSKINEFKCAIRERKDSNKPFLAVCLSHQILCNIFNFQLIRKESPLQGEQKQIDLFGNGYLLGFYNTFSAVFEESKSYCSNIDISYNNDNKEINAIRGSNFYSCQFHPESILSPKGFEILSNEISRII